MRLDANDWDTRYRERTGEPAPAPPAVLVESRHLLPPSGIALDAACGLGAAALFLAETGLQVHAWDFSAVAIDALRDRAAKAGLSVETQVRDVVSNPPPPESFDLIAVSRFLDRTVIADLRDALRPGGLIFYQTFVKRVTGGRGPKRSAFRLDRNELLRLFDGFWVVAYREDDLVGCVEEGIRDEALLVAQKPKPKR